MPAGMSCQPHAILLGFALPLSTAGLLVPVTNKSLECILELLALAKLVSPRWTWYLKIS